jgi:thiol-disulfide isomerase/thioredoxin
MKKLTILFLLFPIALPAQTLNQKASDHKRNNEMLIGYCNSDGFKMIQSNFDSAFQVEYPLYQPDKATVEQLKGKMKNIRITIVMGTWCGDSREWMPRFYKVMDQAGFKYNNLTLICVDHEKKAPVPGLSNLKIERVPTFILYRKKHELGRIVEVPADLLEKDILKIVANKR